MQCERSESICKAVIVQAAKKNKKTPLYFWTTTPAFDVNEKLLQSRNNSSSTKDKNIILKERLIKSFASNHWTELFAVTMELRVFT